jgi:hypothetical protein
MIGLVALILAVELGAGFGDASAEVESMGEESMIVDLRVEVDGSPDSVVAHLALPDEDEIMLPMVVREEGIYGVTTEVKPANYVVVFEVLGDPGTESEPVTLGELGVDFSSNAGTTEPEPEEEVSASTQQWLWLGVALGAASLSALAFWVLGGRDEPTTDAEAETDGIEDGPGSRTVETTEIEDGGGSRPVEPAGVAEEQSSGP